MTHHCRTHEEVESSIGYIFPNEKRYLLEHALTRKGYAMNEIAQKRPCQYQDYLAVIGDGILRAVLSEILVDRDIRLKGHLTKRRSDLERNSTLVIIAGRLGIGRETVRVCGAESLKWAEARQRVLSSTVEALVGAIHRAGGYMEARAKIESWFAEDLLLEA